MPPSPAVVEPSLAPPALRLCPRPRKLSRAGERVTYVITHQHRNALHRV